MRPLSDPFWDTHYPPNGWNCRCTVHQTDARTTQPSEPLEPPSQAFRVNAGKAGMIVSQKHPYYKGATKALAAQEKDAAIDTLKAQVEAWAMDNLLAKTFRKENLQARVLIEQQDALEVIARYGFLPLRTTSRKILP